MKSFPIALTLILSASLANAVSIRNPGTIAGDPATITQDRFEANTPGAVVNPDFEFSAFDFSGVGWDPADSRKSVALISDQHFVAAGHFTPSSTINFLTSSGVESFSVSSFTTITNPAGGTPTGNSDLIIGTLASAIDLDAKGMSSYRVWDSEAASPVGVDILLYGQKGRIGEGSIAVNQDLTVGSVQGKSNVSIYDLAAGSDNDAYITSGDSGGPSFAVEGTELILTGIHWAIGDDDPAPGVPSASATEVYNFDTDVSYYVDQIETQVPGLDVVTTVPEPSSSLLVLSSAFILTLRRKRA